MIINAEKMSLTMADEQEEIVAIACYHDKNNNDMTRKELISLIMDITCCSSRKKAKNHLDYLIQAKKLPTLKRGGCAVTSQKMTTK